MNCEQLKYHKIDVCKFVPRSFRKIDVNHKIVRAKLAYGMNKLEMVFESSLFNGTKYAAC